MTLVLGGGGVNFKFSDYGELLASSSLPAEMIVQGDKTFTLADGTVVTDHVARIRDGLTGGHPAKETQLDTLLRRYKSTPAS